MTDKIKQMVFNARLLWYKHLPIQKNKIILWTSNFKAYSCSPKYITEFICKYYPDEFDLVWVFDNQAIVPIDIPKKVRIVRYFSYEYLYEISTAGFIICNARTGPGHFFNKKCGQCYIQTWHSSIRLKKIERDAITLPEEYVKMAQIDSQKIDLILSGCGFSTNIFRNSFWYSGEVLECGTPRVDMFFKDPSLVKRKVFEYYGIDLKSKLVVYAPTFRDNKKADTHGLNQELLLKTLEIKTAEKWVLGIRMHPNIPDDICACNEKIIPMSKYPDMQELIVACDLLITDYSSCMFDAAIAKRACILFAPDLEKYLRDERGLYFAFRELPFLVAMNNEELSKVIMDFSRTTYEKKVDDFLESIESYEEGDASKKVVEYMMEIIGKE